MQTTKDYIRKLLLETAQKAFFEKGFKSVSMREISKLSGIGLSNIYNYFSCKDDIFVQIVTPAVRTFENMLDEHHGRRGTDIMVMCDRAAMYRMLEDHNRPENFSLDIFISDEYHRASLQELMGIITRYRSELNLLFFSTQHSRLKDYLEEWIEKSATIGMEYMEKMRRLHPELHTDISPFFMHFTCSWWINMMKEVVQHKELSCEEIECFISEYIRFSTGGWKKLMNVKNER